MMVRLLLVSGVLVHWSEHGFPALADPEMNQVYCSPILAGCPDHQDMVKCSSGVCLQGVLGRFSRLHNCAVIFRQIRLSFRMSTEVTKIYPVITVIQVS